jgi:5-oxoprolinase (ATP-hydrolysing)
MGLGDLVVTPYLNLRFQGTDFALMTPGPPVTAASLDDLVSSLPSYHSSFLQRYKTEFGFDLSNRDVIVDDIRMQTPSIQTAL